MGKMLKCTDSTLNGHIQYSIGHMSVRDRNVALATLVYHRTPCIHELFLV